MRPLPLGLAAADGGAQTRAASTHDENVVGGARVGSGPVAGILMVGLLAPGDEGYGALVVMVGGAYAAAGALLGGLLGAAVVPKRERVLYEAPLDRYLAAPPEN